MMKLLVGAFLLLINSNSILALGETGHRISGAIAEHYLSDDSRIAISELIGEESLAEISTYVDMMRSNPKTFWQKTANPYHYATIPPGKTYKEIGTPKQGDAVFALAKYSKIFKDLKSSKAERTLALKFIVHLIGDLHQPLHVGTGLDRGGNRVKVKFFGRRNNLHSVWDSGMINRSQLSYTEWTSWLNKNIGKEQLKQWSSIDPQQWMRESVTLRDLVYPENIENPDLGYDYLYNNMPRLKLRLKQAGVRIALYLNHLTQTKP